MKDPSLPALLFVGVFGLLLGAFGIGNGRKASPSPETARALIEFDQWRAIYTDFLRQGKSITEAADLTDGAMEVIGYHTPARED